MNLMHDIIELPHPNPTPHCVKVTWTLLPEEGEGRIFNLADGNIKVADMKSGQVRFERKDGDVEWFSDIRVILIDKTYSDGQTTTSRYIISR